MKKVLALLLTLVSLLSAAALAETAGGWTVTDTAALPIPEAALKAYDTAVEVLLGVDYSPVALLATQQVAGRNYCFLCEGTIVVPGGEKGYYLVYVYEDLQGNAEVTDIAKLAYGIDQLDDADGASEALLGGWQVCDNAEAALSEGAAAAFGKAVEGLTGAEYAPVAELATQLVAGRNYCILCEVTPVVPDAVPACVKVYVYEDLDGNARILGTQAIRFGAED